MTTNATPRPRITLEPHPRKAGYWLAWENDIAVARFEDEETAKRFAAAVNAYDVLVAVKQAAERAYDILHADCGTPEIPECDAICRDLRAALAAADAAMRKG